MVNLFAYTQFWREDSSLVIVSLSVFKSLPLKKQFVSSANSLIFEHLIVL